MSRVNRRKAGRPVNRDSSAVGLRAMADAEYAHGDSVVLGAHIGLGLVEPLDPIWWHRLVDVKILGLQPEFGEHFLHRNTLAALCKASLPVGKSLAVLLYYGLIVAWRRSQGSPDGIEQHELQESNRRGDL